LSETCQKIPRTKLNHVVYTANILLKKNKDFFNKNFSVKTFIYKGIRLY
jgi:hypothetical protein